MISNSAFTQLMEQIALPQAAAPTLESAAPEQHAVLRPVRAGAEHPPFAAHKAGKARLLYMPKKRRALSPASVQSSAVLMPSSPARHSAVNTQSAGSLVLPRHGTGAR